MLDLLTTDAFAAWFSGLAEIPAEDVAATIEVIAQLGAGTEAPGSSELLLWYEHPSVASRGLPDIVERLAPEVVKFANEYGRFNGYVRRVIRHLESAPFVARLSRLSAEDTAKVADALCRIRRLATTRMLSIFDLQARRRLWPYGSPSPSAITACARLVDPSEVREWYYAALAAAGFEVVDVPSHTAALREITLRTTAPGLRILYGIDAAKNRGLIVVGEWLDRSFYGDSVRLAEALWAQFLAGRPLATQVAGAR
ncbi:MAG TPA: hypothetical protein VK841_18615 [Polyangiaceae bacterium]|nr:hypothetical protein [Polyangiaceae bacterium]